MTELDGLRHDWTEAEVAEIFALPMTDLLHQAHLQHRQCFDPNRLQLSTLMNIKSGGCPEDCTYCPQSVRYPSGRSSGRLKQITEVVAAAQAAKSQGATRFCMGAAWRSPKAKDLQIVAEMIEAVKGVGMQTCVTLGMLDQEQADTLKAAGLDYYNHNLDTSEAYYEQIITTRTYQDRLDTLASVRNAGINVCCGGIVGMGETRMDRVSLLLTLANLPQHPESVPINRLVRVAGTPLSDCPDLDPMELVRTVAVARILLPASYVRLSAGRLEMSDELQLLCYFAGANSIFYGEQLLTTENPSAARDRTLFSRLGLTLDS
jgi:biotin synthase